MSGPLLDTCGTGGDGLGTINVSSAVSLLMAAAGIKVAKHGNRAVSGKTGSADVLKAMGVPVDLGIRDAARSLETCHFAFFFAPRYHESLRHVSSLRRELGFRTLFNLMGPLANPVGATHQLVGVFDRERVEDMAWILKELGVARAAVVSGFDGMDEFTLSGPSRVCLTDGNGLESWEWTPEELGLTTCEMEDLVGGTPEENAREIEAILTGFLEGPKLDLILANAGLALWVAERVANPADGVARARELITSGRVGEALETIRAFS